MNNTSSTINTFSATVASLSKEGLIVIRLDSPEGAVVGEIKVSDTGGLARVARGQGAHD